MAEIRTEPRPACLLCGSQGRELYRGLEDRLFGVPGQWTLKQCPNPACRLVWLDPAPMEADLPLTYERYYTHPGDDDGEVRPPSRLYGRLREAYLASHYGYAVPQGAHRLGQLIRLHPGWRAEADFSVYRQGADRTGMHLLDVGCGDGSALLRLRALGWSRLEGVDLDPAAVELARQHGLAVRTGTLEAQTYPEGSFDVLTMSHVLEHVPDPVGFLRECHRILRPGGELVVYTPNFESLTRRLTGARWRGLEPPRHLQLFNRRNLQAALQKSGRWGIVSLRTSVRGAGVHFLASSGTPSPSLPTRGRERTRLIAHLYTYFFAATLWVRPGIGEELVLVTRRAG